MRSCHYRNVCLENETLVYYQDPEQVPVEAKHLDVLVTPMGSTVRDFSPYKLNPVVRAGKIPDGHEYFTAKDGTGVITVIFGEYNYLGFGHHISDLLLPIFRVMQLFGLEQRQTRLLHVDDFAKPYMYSCEHFKPKNLQLLVEVHCRVHPEQREVGGPLVLPQPQHVLRGPGGRDRAFC